MHLFNFTARLKSHWKRLRLYRAAAPARAEQWLGLSQQDDPACLELDFERAEEPLSFQLVQSVNSGLHGSHATLSDSAGGGELATFTWSEEFAARNRAISSG